MNDVIIYIMIEHNETIEVRLADGISNIMGRVEIGFHGLWGTVCDANWDIHDAHVVCRQLGYDKALVATINSAFGKGVGNVWGELLNCRGEETKVEDCNIRISPTYGSCSNHAEDVGVVCTGAGLYTKSTIIIVTMNVFLCIYVPIQNCDVTACVIGISYAMYMRDSNYCS